MIGADGTLAAKAFDGIQDLKSATSIEELKAVISPLMNELGFQSYARARFYTANGTSSPFIMYGQVNRWGTRYFERGYAAKSAIARELLVRRAAYTWSDIYRTRALDAQTQLILAEAQEYGQRDGLFLPVRSPDGAYGAITLCGTNDLSDPLLRAVTEVLAAYYASEGDRLTRTHEAPKRLSRRQRECLAWVRVGKSSADIADILNLSVPTVDGHIAEACRKLGVRTRIQAVVDACLLGLIDG